MTESVEPVRRNSQQWKRLRQEFVEAQAGQCAICGADVTESPHLDHCHATGFVRGALCPSCNVKLGWYEGRRKEIETYLARAAEYAAHVVLPTQKRAKRWRSYWQGR